MPDYSSNGSADCDKQSNDFPNHTNYSYNKLDDDIVISGISGRFPECDTFEEFREKLLAGVDLVTDDERRWPRGIYGLPARNGKVKNIQHFDATFFGVPPKLAHVMDPQLRMLLEATYEAIIDAGVNPVDIRGSRTAVIVAQVAGESEEFWEIEPDKVNGYTLIGCSRGMFSNRVSYSFDFKGPSYTIDVKCAGSLFAFQQAFAAIRSGECDSAIVGAVNVLLKPVNSLNLHRLNMISPDGIPRCFDAGASGYVRSEAAIAVFLQKATVANRIYATVLNIKTNNDGYKEEGITHPSDQMQAVLMRETYAEIGISPSDISYFEAHSPGTRIGDLLELNTISNVFCKTDRPEPLLVGSVKSNMGHAESAAGLCSIAKVIIAMETGTIAGNLHFKNPNPNVAALSNGCIQVVDKNLPWQGGLVAVNCYGVGGANSHAVLKPNPKRKTLVTPDNIPRLVPISGRTEEAVNTFFEKLSKQPLDVELIGLLHNIYKTNIPGHDYRGYVILGDKPQREVQFFNREKRPAWFVYGGLGSQWAGMGRDLMVLEPFEKSIKKCADALKPEGFDLVDIIMNSDNSTFNNIINTLTVTAAIQVALTDLLSAIGIQPDGFLGHSVGELGCAYADGTLTAEQVVLAAYWRGRCVLESKSPPGAMAAIGLSWEEAKARAPPGITPASHNGAEIVTVAGLPEDVKKFVTQLKSEGVFAKEVASCGYAFHSENIADAAPKFKTQLKKIIPKSKLRSSKWISTSIPESSWLTALASSSSPAYHLNNFLSPVLFYDALQHIPDDAVVFEIAPHALMQSILKRSLGRSVVNIGLIDRSHPNNLQFLLSNIGKAYLAGLQPNVAKLYKPIKFPVSRGTPMIQSMIRWDHSAEWSVADFRKVSRNLITDNGSTKAVTDQFNYADADKRTTEGAMDKTLHSIEKEFSVASSKFNDMKHSNVINKLATKTDLMSSPPVANGFPGSITIQFDGNGLSLKISPLIGEANGINDNLSQRTSSNFSTGDIYHKELEAPLTTINEEKKKKDINLRKPDVVGSQKTSLDETHPVVAKKVNPQKSDEVIFKDYDLACANKTDLVSAAADVLGIEEVKSINNSLTFVELGLDSLMGEEIQQVLENHKIILTPEEVRCLTFKRLHQLAM